MLQETAAAAAAAAAARREELATEPTRVDSPLSVRSVTTAVGDGSAEEADRTDLTAVADRLFLLFTSLVP